MTDSDLNTVFSQVHQNFSKNRVFTFDAVFYPYRSIKNTISWSGRHISVRISERLRHAPLYILEIIAHLLLSKLYNKRPERRLRQIYFAYCTDVFPQKTNPPKGYNSTGKCFDLKERFDHLNLNYFDSGLHVKNIGWSKRRSFTRLGFYDRGRDLLVISSVFDENSVPSEVVDYLLYHEMLHVKYPVHSKSGRRIVHSSEFKKAEKAFPDYTKVKKWIEKYLKTRRGLLRSF